MKFVVKKWAFTLMVGNSTPRTDSMKLSTTSVTKIADALKPAVIDYIYEDEGFVEYMQTAVVEGIRNAMGDMDEDLLFELGMLIFDRIELK